MTNNWSFTYNANGQSYMPNQCRNKAVMASIHENWIKNVKIIIKL